MCCVDSPLLLPAVMLGAGLPHGGKGVGSVVVLLGAPITEPLLVGGSFLIGEGSVLGARGTRSSKTLSPIDDGPPEPT